MGDPAREAIDKVLSPHGWTFVGSRTAGIGVVEYTVERVADKRRANLRRTIAEMVLNPIDRGVDEIAPDLPVAMTLVLGLLLLVKEENVKHPVETKP